MEDVHSPALCPHAVDLQAGEGGGDGGWGRAGPGGSLGAAAEPSAAGAG